MEHDDNAKTSLEVTICNETVTVYSDEGQEHIQRMADYINHITAQFIEKKGYNVRQDYLFLYAALELCNSLFIKKDTVESTSDRNYEKLYQIEIFSHKKTQDLLEITQRKLEETEKQLKSTQKELDEFISTFDLGLRETGNNHA